MSAVLPTDTRLFIPASEVARKLSIGVSTVWALAKDEKLPAPIKIGGATRWRVADLERFAGSTSLTTTP